MEELNEEAQEALERISQLSRMGKVELTFNQNLLWDRYERLEDIADELLDMMIVNGMKGKFCDGINAAKTLILEHMDQIEIYVDEIDMFLDSEDAES